MAQNPGNIEVIRRGFFGPGNLMEKKQAEGTVGAEAAITMASPTIEKQKRHRTPVYPYAHH